MDLRKELGNALWFAFILLSLSYWKQRRIFKIDYKPSCDLLSFYYLCRTGNNPQMEMVVDVTVVICFHFTIFVVLETTRLCNSVSLHQLWFAFILLSLSYWKQPFAVLIKVSPVLWFAFILLSLSYWKQHHAGRSHPILSCDLLSFYYLCRTGNNRARSFGTPPSVVICFHFTIFVVLETTFRSAFANKRSCDLLSFYYLCRTGNNERKVLCYCSFVVICFHFTIFVVLETTKWQREKRLCELWFAFILLSLSYWKQRYRRRPDRVRCCDLLSFYYLCRTGNN